MLAEELVAKLILLNATDVARNFDFGVLLFNRLLQASGLGLPDVLFAEQKLPVQVAHVDRVKVDDRQLHEAAHTQALDKLTADATGSNHEHFCGSDESGNFGTKDNFEFLH